MNAQKCLDILREIKDVAFATVMQMGYHKLELLMS